MQQSTLVTWTIPGANLLVPWGQARAARNTATRAAH
jgi:hypothetical protein